MWSAIVNGMTAVFSALHNFIVSLGIPENKEGLSYVLAIFILNNNKPEFTEKDYTTKSFENYSELDSLGRCGVAYANVCKEIMPPERR